MAKHVTKSHMRNSLAMLMLLAWGCSHFAMAQGEPAREQPSSAYSHARIQFRQGKYEAALLLLGTKPQGLPALWIKAESLFRLQRYDEAHSAFKELLVLERDPLEQQKIAVRLFDSELLSGHIDAALKSYHEYVIRYKSSPEAMKYGLGKALYDRERYEDALPLLNAIPAGNEYAMRARFLVAAMKLGHEDLSDLIKRFSAIEAMVPISVEDYGVRQLAILAQARLLADKDRFIDAKKAYDRVSLKSPFAKEATAELIRMAMRRADSAQGGLGSFKDASPEYRSSQQQKFLQEARDAMARYRAVQEVGFRDPELLTLLAELLVKSRRYDDARLAYGELINHYRPIAERLQSSSNNTKLWPYFQLNFAAKPGSVDQESLVPGVPPVFLNHISGLSELRTMKQRIEANGQKLRELEYRAKLEGRSDAALDRAKKNEQAIISIYELSVVGKQAELARASVKAINALLAEAEFKRAELPLLYKRDLRKQEDAISDFQSTTLEQFERTIKAKDRGDSQ